MRYRFERHLLFVLIGLNAIVLLGQLWPEGAPPFARIVNVIFLISTLCIFATEVWRRSRT
jgi:hypothetical protein